LEGGQRREVLTHLLRGCPSCRRVLDGLERPSRQPLPPEGGDGLRIDARAIASALRPRMARVVRERAEAVQSVESLSKLPPDEQRELALRAAVCQSRAFVAAFLEAAWNALLDDPQRALQMSELALEVAEHLEPDDAGPEALEDLRARAWGRVANCRRALSDFDGAHRALQQARVHLARGSGNPLERAEVLYMEASLLRDQKRFSLALTRLEQSGSIYRELGETSHEGRTYLAEAGIFSYDGRNEEAVLAAQKAIQLIDVDRQPKLALAARHNLVVALARLERYQEALEVLVLFRDEYDRHGDRMSQLRRDWTEGMILRGLGRHADAEARWRSTIAGFAAAGMPYEVAEVTLELATLLVETGRHSEIAGLASDSYRLFTALNLDSAAIAAWLVLREAAEKEAVSMQLLGSLAAYYRAAKGRPGLAFRT
ncbi:MAG: hypothetical protein K8H90_05660, partial [Thermoanaerobaculia bacterium]|nr:hypothetical protein [Thermoanaerobaculia bacterium]